MSWLVQKQVNVLVGMPVPGFFKHSRIYTGYGTFVDSCLLSYVVTYFIGIIRSEENNGKLMFGVCACVFSAQALSIKLFTRYYKIKLLDLVEECAPSAEETPSPQYKYTPRMLPYIMNVFVTLSCVVYNSRPLISIFEPDGNRNLSLPAYFPFSTNVSPNFELAVLYEASSGLYVCCTTAAFYDFYVNIGARLITKYYHLRKDLPQVFNDKENIHENLREWVIRHQTTTRLEAKFQYIFAPGLLIVFSFEVVVLCLLVYDTTMVELDALSKAAMFSFSLGFMFKLFIVTRCGDHITHESNRITEDGFGAMWYDLPLEAQNSFKIIICKAKRDVTISAMGFFNLNTDSFRSFALTSYSYYAFLVNMGKST